MGIRRADLGEVLQPGTPIVSLQTLDPLYGDFQVPARQLAALSEGLEVRARSDVFDLTLEGTIETIDYQVQEATRTVRVRAQVANPEERVRPGMFLDVEAVRPQRRTVRVVPNTAILYAPYGDSLYVVEGDESPTAQQRFVRLGERRGDLVEVLEGVEPGQVVVTTGAFKLQNGAAVQIENEISPAIPWPTPIPRTAEP